MTTEAPKPAAAGVLVPKWILGVAAAALGLALLGVGFLLGERSNRGPGSSADVSVTATERAPASGSAERTDAVPGAFGSAQGGSPGFSAGLPSAPTSPLVAEVRRYLDEFGRIQDAGSAVSDPREFASVLLGQAQQGDMRGIDDLVGKSERMGRELAALRPPPPCVEHHRLARDLATEATGLLRRLRGAIEQQDVLTLTSIATEGTTLEGKAKTLARETDRLTREYATR